MIAMQAKSLSLRLAVALAALPVVFVMLRSEPAVAQPANDAPLQISWEVRNRFRLFREERDFQLQAEALRSGSILAAEDALEVQSDGRGWARNAVNRLCIDRSGHVSEPCNRDGTKESYLTPIDHPVTVRLAGQIPVGATCAWKPERISFSLPG